MLLRQLERGLEEVHEQTRSAVQSGDRLCGGNALETTVAQQLAHDSAVLLLDPRLVVLPPRPRASEFDPMSETVIDQGLVHKLAAIVDIQRTKREGQSQANTFERLNKQAALSNHQRRRLRPAARDVGQDQTVDVAAAVGVAAMRDTVHLHASRRRL